MGENSLPSFPSLAIPSSAASLHCPNEAAASVVESSVRRRQLVGRTGACAVVFRRPLSLVGERALAFVEEGRRMRSSSCLCVGEDILSVSDFPTFPHHRLAYERYIRIVLCMTASGELSLCTYINVHAVNTWHSYL